MCCLINLPSAYSEYLCNRHARPKGEKSVSKDIRRVGSSSSRSVKLKIGEKLVAAVNMERKQKYSG